MKTITVSPNKRLSLQYHNHRKEHWRILSGCAVVLKDNLTYRLSAGDSIDIEIQQKHRVENPLSEQLVVLEIQSGKVLDENDIVRLDDDYGRKTK